MSEPELSNELMLQNALAQIAKNYIGIREIGGNNKGQMIERFQKAVDGKAHGEPYCLGGVWHCIDEAQVTVEAILMKSLDVRPELFRTEHCMTMWIKSPKIQRVVEPAPGVLLLWEHYMNGKATAAGHVAIITEVLGEKLVRTVEFNTGQPTDQVVRLGDGVYEKTRNLEYYYGSMRPKGLLAVW